MRYVNISASAGRDNTQIEYMNQILNLSTCRFKEKKLVPACSGYAGNEWMRALYQANELGIGHYAGSVHTTGFFDDVAAVGVNRMWADKQFFGNGTGIKPLAQ